MSKIAKLVPSVFSISPLRLPIIIFLTAFICQALFSSDVHSAQVTLAWDANTDPNIAGYKVYYGSTSRGYQAVIDAGNNPTYTISNLQGSSTYYFTVTDYNTSGIESGYSNEVSYTVPGACTYSISPTSQAPGSSGSPGTVSVTASSGCAWTAVSNASWITITSNSSVTGSGTVNYSVSSNSSSSSRSGSMTIAGKTFTVTQSAVACSYSISLASRSLTSTGGTGSVSVTSPSGCSWTASSSAVWITITSGSSGSGNGTTGYSVSANSGSATRTGTLTVAGQTFTVTQAGVSQYTLSVNKTGTASGTVATNPQGTIFNQRTVVTLTANPDSNASFAGWSGGCAGTSPTCSVTMNSNTLVTATFNLKTFTITASAGSNGSISPQGAATVNYGVSQSFTITPATGYGVSDVKADGVSVGAVTSYLFGNVMANHTIAATFAALPSLPASSTVVLGIKAGGSDYISGNGVHYLADRYFSGGVKGKTGSAIKGTTEAPLYQTGRSGNFSYAIPLANGNYDLTLKFAENTYSSSGERIFDVLVRGTTALKDFDMYNLSGRNTALDVTFTVSVTSGILNIQFVPTIGDAQINALLISTASSTPKSPPGRIRRYYTTEPTNSGNKAP